MSLSQRSVNSVTWNVGANFVSAVVLFGRSVLLARWLPVEVFGIYALAISVVTLSSMVNDLGVGSAFVHRSAEVEDEEHAAAVHFTLKCILVSGWVVLLVLGALIFTDGQTRTALLLLTITTGLGGLTSTPRVILVRRVVHRRLALIRFLSSILITLVTLGLAWRGITLWALLAADIVASILSVVGLYIWRPVWRPRLTWSPPVMRYLLRFGSRVFLASLLERALDRIDDLWVGIYLGETWLGFYSRAYTFATYPRQLLAVPINTVAGGTYAELKGDRRRLSRAFFRLNAFLIRSGFFLGGLLFLIAPEFIRLILGSKWLPMLDAFRLMLVFTLLDPIKGTIASLLGVAVGKPELVVHARLAQLAVLGAGLLVLGPRLGIVGVALAVDTMLVAGIAILLWQVRPYVDFSLARWFAAPGLALGLAMLFAYGATMLLEGPGTDWVTGAVKTVVFATVYSFVLVAIERDHLFEAVAFLNSSWRLKRI